jgi:DNA-binding NarL/FixJ family response regulator
VATLTVREREVLSLHLVEGTVKGYVSAILTRLNLDNRVQAAILAHEADLVPDR